MTITNEIKYSFNKGSILTKLLYVNAGVFLIAWILFTIIPSAIQYFVLPGKFSTLLFRPWTIVSYMFLHLEFMHLLINLLWLFWFGKMFLNYFNGKQLLAVYLIGGFTGAAFHLIVNHLTVSPIPMLGASAAVMAVVFAVAFYKPERQIYLIFVGPVKIKYIALIVMIIDIMGAVSGLKTGMSFGDGVAHIAHLGGAFYGLLFAYMMRSEKDITKGFNDIIDGFVTLFGSSSSQKNRAKMKVTRERFGNQKPKSDSEYNQSSAKNLDEINRILDKISKSGYDSLTKKEKEFLFKQKG